MKNDSVIVEYISRYNDFRYLHSLAHPPEETPREAHHDLFEICIFISGDVLYYIDGKSYTVRRGDILYISNRELHRLKVLSPAKYERIVIHFNSQYLENLGPDSLTILDFIVQKEPGTENKIDGFQIEEAGIDTILRRIEEYATSDLPERHIMIEMLFVEFLVALKTVIRETSQPVSAANHQDKRVTEIMEYIRQNLDTRMSLDFFAERLHINKYHLCHLFKRETGFTIFEYISNKRIIKAKEYLLQGIPVIEACYQVGFTDYANFYKIFKRITGTTPRRFTQNAVAKVGMK